MLKRVKLTYGGKGFDYAYSVAQGGVLEDAVYVIKTKLYSFLL